MVAYEAMTCTQEWSKDSSSTNLYEVIEILKKGITQVDW